METGPMVFGKSMEIELNPETYRTKLQEEVAKERYAKNESKMAVEFIREVAHWFGYEGFDDTEWAPNKATDLLVIMDRDKNTSEDWLPVVSWEEASTLAQRGRLVVVGCQPADKEMQATIVVVAPEMPKHSDVWGCAIPCCAQVWPQAWYGKPMDQAFTANQGERIVKGESIYYYCHEAPRK